MVRWAAVFASAFFITAFTPAESSSGLHDFEDLSLAPAGDRVLNVESFEAGHGVIVLRDSRGTVIAQYDPCHACKYADTAWSPRGDAIAFTGAVAGKTTLYIVQKGSLRVSAQIMGVANTLRFSPDGKTLGALVTVGARKLAGATEAGAAQTGNIGASVDEERIAAVPVSGGDLRLLSPDDTYIYEYDWMPDGQGLVATGAKGDGDNNWWIATLDYVDARTGSLRVIAAPDVQMSLPRVSPDGRSVAFVGGLMSDWGLVGGDIYTVPLTGGVPVDVTPGFKGSFNGIAWRGGRMLASALVDDRSTVVWLDPGAHTVRTLWSARVETRTQRMDSQVALSGNGRIAAAITQDFTRAKEITLGKLPELAPITHENAALSANVSVQSVHWKNEGYELQGWLIGPRQVDATVGHPLIVQVHGGPSAAYTPRYVLANGQQDAESDFTYELIQKGYYFFYPNSRGSFGQGEAFTRANIRDFGGGDLRDLLAGVDAVEKLAPVDDARLGLYGHSYGGWFAMWANTQTRRFKVFVAAAGVANWTSYFGQNGIDRWMIPFFGASVYDDPAAYRAASPIEFIKQAGTPTLIYVGERDVECPAPQSLEYWHALHALGIPVELYIYPGEGHVFRQSGNITDVRARVVGWFEGYLGKADQVGGG